MLTTAKAESSLRTAGVRLTPQRRLLVQLLVGNRTHPTIEALYIAARAHYPTLSLATVYHTVALLARQGLVQELRGSSDGLRCDPDTSPHAHAYCDRCGQVYDIPWSPPADCVTSPKGFRVTALELSIHGKCADCQTSSATPPPTSQ